MNIGNRYFNTILHLDSLKKTIKKKKKPFSGVLVSQMLAAREAEKQRIVEVNISDCSVRADK